jgi:His-Xaa-Ser system protein HxsD
MRLEFAKAAYSSTALQKAAYEVASELTIVIKEEGQNFVADVTSVAKEKAEPDVSAFVRCANDYALRERLASQTAPLRNLILAHAYSKTQFIRQ